MAGMFDGSSNGRRRRPVLFRQHDVTRALRAARAAGLEVTGYEVDPVTGKIIVNTSTEIKPSPETDFDRWKANRASKAKRPQLRS
jgi:hypothetical protein